uniref:ATP-dependent Clp protease proteolytic subunit n=1 Tax=Hypertelis spergulacea TaxID=764270 RepID=A0A411L8W4_9CARY|nr:clp protease proteolytic subunit [Hypertelis spergulacea]
MPIGYPKFEIKVERVALEFYGKPEFVWIDQDVVPYLGRLLMLFQEIDDEMAANMIGIMTYYNIEDDMEPMQLWINSWGGLVNAGLSIYDMIEESEVPVESYCLGTAGSIAALLMTSGVRGKRWAFPHGRFIIQQPTWTLTDAEELRPEDKDPTITEEEDRSDRGYPRRKDEYLRKPSKYRKRKDPWKWKGDPVEDDSEDEDPWQWRWDPDSEDEDSEDEDSPQYSLEYWRPEEGEEMIKEKKKKKIIRKRKECIVEAREMFRVRERIVNIYARRTGQPESVVSEDLERGFLMNSQEAKEYGILDNVVGSD